MALAASVAYPRRRRLGITLYPTSIVPASSGGPWKPISPITVPLRRSIITQTPKHSVSTDAPA
jgi:hypothetical protein